MTSEKDAGFGKALLVERCNCPDGHSGLSCEVTINKHTNGRSSLHNFSVSIPDCKRILNLGSWGVVKFRAR